MDLSLFLVDGREEWRMMNHKMEQSRRKMWVDYKRNYLVSDFLEWNIVIFVMPIFKKQWYLYTFFLNTIQNLIRKY